jgi:hypothetical protein
MCQHMQGAFWGIVSSGIAVVLVALVLTCYCCRNRLLCRHAPVKGEVDRVRMDIENPRTDVTVDLGASSAIDGGSGGVMMPTTKIGAMHGESAPSPADRLEEELRKNMRDAGGENQVPSVQSYHLIQLPLSCPVPLRCVDSCLRSFFSRTSF